MIRQLRRFRRGTLALLAGVLTLSVAGAGTTLALMSSSQGATSGTVTASSSFTYPLNWSTTTPGSYQVTWPAGTSTLTFTVCGGGGAAGVGTLAGSGALGGCVSGSLTASVAPGSAATMYVYVAGSGSGSAAGTGYASGGAGGAATNVGGGGGGSSAILLGAVSNSNVLAIAPGGGGGGAGQTAHAGGAGGAGASGTPSTNGTSGSNGAGGGSGGSAGAKGNPTSITQIGGTPSTCSSTYGGGGGGAGSAGGGAGVCNATSGGGGGGGASYVNTAGFAYNSVTYKVGTGPTGAANTVSAGSATISYSTAPAFVSAATASTPAGSAFNVAVTATGSPTPLLSESGTMPSGVTFTDNGNGTATFSGTSSVAAGSYSFTLSAINAVSTATQTFTLNVSQAPVITSVAGVAFRVSTAGTFTVNTTGGPTPSLSESGTLPSGVTFTDNANGTATLSGTPAAGTTAAYPLTITASNSQGSTSQSFTLDVFNVSLAANSPQANSGTTVTTGSFTLAANTTYLVLAMTRDGTAGSDAMTVGAGTNFTTNPSFTQIGTTQAYDNNGVHYAAWYTTGGSGSGTIKVTMINATVGAYVEVLQLAGNNTSSPIVTGTEGSANSGTTAGTSATANLSGAPTDGDFEVIFQNNLAAIGNPTSTNAGIILVPSSHLQGGGGSGITVSAFSGAAISTDTITLASSQIWGTMSVEIAHG